MLLAIFPPLSSLIWLLGKRKWHFITFWSFIIAMSPKGMQGRKCNLSCCPKSKIFPIFQHSNSGKNVKGIFIVNRLVLKHSLEPPAATFGYWNRPSWIEGEGWLCLAIYLSFRNLFGSIIKGKGFKDMKRNLIL